MSVRWILVVMAAVVLLGCSDGGVSQEAGPSNDEASADTAMTIEDSGSGTATGVEDPDEDPDPEADPNPDADSDPEPETTVLDGIVVAEGGVLPLAGATVSGGGDQAVTGADGRFSLTTTGPLKTVTVNRPGWQGRDVELPSADPGSSEPDPSTDSEPSTDGSEIDGGNEPFMVELQPFTVRGLRVSRRTAADPERFEQLLALADSSTVNALVFDTKDETGSVLYATHVELASTIGSVVDVYDPAELLALAREHELYSITRIVVFEDPLWAEAVPEAGLAGTWVDAGDEANWRYPLELAVEACTLGFQEIQFDYVRFPAGRTAEVAAGLLPGDSEARSSVIAGFLEAAASELHPLGCGLSAAVFGIVTSSPTDEGIGQRWELVSAPIDAVSPMVYPSHYSRGWLGLTDPEQAPGPVVADALDQGLNRLEQPTLMRPWLQAFNYNAGQVLAQIDEAEERGAGWMLWSAAGNYRLEWLPPA